MDYQVVTLYSNQLNRDKKVFIYLPDDYEDSKVKYQVLYMHDGQNLFDDSIAYMKRSWRIMDVYKNNPNLKKLIIIGIQSDDVARADELIPYKFNYKDDIIWGGEADKYLDFIVNDVKPYVDSNFRTLTDAENTGIMGSSFGGINSIYASIKYSHYFTRFGCVSNALMYGFYDQLKKNLLNKTYDNIKKFYMDCGDLETEDKQFNDLYIKYNDEVYDILKGKIDNQKLKYEIIKGGIHHESSWEVRFKDIIMFLFED